MSSTAKTQKQPTKAFILGRFRNTSHDLLSTEKSLLSIPTCFGKIELSGLRCISLFSMFVNIAAFCVLLAILVQVYYLQSNHNFLIVEYTVDAARFRDIITNSVKTATLYAACLPVLNISVMSKGINTTTAVMTSSLVTTQLNNYNRFMDRFPVFLNRVISNLTQEEIQLLQLNDTSLYVNSSSIQLEAQAASLLKKGQSLEALKLLLTDEYLNISSTANKLEPIVKYVNDKELATNTKLSSGALAGLVIVCVSMAIVIPVVVLTLVCALNRDALYRKRLQRANAVMLIDTMQDSQLRELFRKHCEKEHSLDNYLFLERIGEYKNLCAKSFEIKSVLFDYSSSDMNDDSMSVTTAITNNSDLSENGKKKKKSPHQYTEQDLKEVEKKKFELATLIYSEFLRIEGAHSVNISKKMADTVKLELERISTTTSGSSTEKEVTSPNTTSSSTDQERPSVGIFDWEEKTLSERLFDELENEIAIVMIDTHHRFKLSLEFQKQMKIHNIQTKLKQQQKGASSSNPTTANVISPPPSNSVQQQNTVVNFNTSTTTVND
ncbi:hypothetical protein C9374_008302 [Naegleria lovaniensis]|uniref:RGS domain-containing protein n=1 Tax=Naegleria lovaniensis TaxID=51637 RepID=A0AA88GHI5_NAELO|nr:uncharacterized protein C9374_008302 [Naegleria lovaniensis]KAG2378663.1 hypothetical protein C9374_008302 [Naegleria lovaniensis]